MSERKTILVVDDERLNINVLVELLEKEYRLLVAKNGEQAFKRLRGEVLPDLILLDIMMPGMSGYEVLTRLRADAATRDIPVIFVTALGQTGDETRGFELGAMDYIRKPFNPAAVRARVRTHLALSEAYRTLERKNELLLYERSMIENIILRMRDSSPIDDADIRTLVTPVEKTAGDIILAARRPDGVLHLLLGDFTGHGLSAAIGGPMVDDLFREMTVRGEGPEAILAAINRKLYERLPADIFMATCLLSWRRTEKKLRLWNCGMPEVLVLRDGRCLHQYPSRKMALGIIPRLDTTCHHHFQARSGDRIFAFSDGITETRPDGEEEMFGLDRLIRVLAADPIDTLQETLERFRGGGQQSDDITLIELTSP